MIITRCQINRNFKLLAIKLLLVNLHKKYFCRRLCYRKNNFAKPYFSFFSCLFVISVATATKPGKQLAQNRMSAGGQHKKHLLPGLALYLQHWGIHVATKVQSTLVISKLKGPSETLRDIHTSTYQIFRIEEKYKSHNQIAQMNM